MALSLSTPWHYMADLQAGEVQADALLTLRGMLGSRFASTPTDEVLLSQLKGAVRRFEAATDRFFVPITGSHEIHGNGAARLFLPHPVVSADQIAGSTFELQYVGADSAVDATSLGVNDGAWDGEDDPRQAPWVEWVTGNTTDYNPGGNRLGAFSYGVRNIQVTATWGYLDPDGQTPHLVKEAVARLVLREMAAIGDCDDQEDLRRGALLSESVAGRSFNLGANAQGRGLTTDREIDALIRRFRRPPAAIISRPTRRARRRRSLF